MQFSTVQLSLKVKSEIIDLFIYLLEQINTLIKINMIFNHGVGGRVNKNMLYVNSSCTNNLVQ